MSWEINCGLKAYKLEKDAGSPIAGAKERIPSLRSRFNQLTASITRYEARVANQTAQLAKMNRRAGSKANEDIASLEQPADAEDVNGFSNELPISADDLEREEQEIRELEKKKQALEDRVSGMERDLGGLLR
ncbi:MAG: hypothetical protein Q9222_003627 [Ikaeria aurantiellina]